MIYDINTLPQIELLKFLLALKERYTIDAIDEQKAKTEIEQQEKALLRHKQLEKEIAQRGYSREELLDVITTRSGQSILSDPEYESNQAPKEVFGNFLYQGEMGLLVGRNNENLSILANDIAFFVGGGGHKWSNFESPHLPTLYIDMETTSKQFAQRYRSAINYVPETFTRAEVDVLSAGNEKVIMSMVKSHIIKSQGDTNSPKFVIIDHISPTLFKNAQIKAFIGELKTIKEQYGLTILLVSNCLKSNNKKPIVEDTLGTSKVLLSFVESAFALGTSFQEDDIRYIKQIKTSGHEKEKKVMTVDIKYEPYLSMNYLDMTEEETHIDPKHMKCYYNFTPEEEMQLVDLLTRKNNGERIYYAEIAQKTGVPYDIVVLYDIQNFHDAI